MTKEEPRPTLDWRRTWPPWPSTIWRTMARPRPVPPSARERALSARQKRSKTWGWSSAEMPGPSSATAIQALSPSLPVARRMREPAGARRTALSSRLATARLRASRSPVTTTLGAMARAGGGRDHEVFPGLVHGPAEVDQLVLEGRLLAPGEGQEVVDEAGHAVAGPLDHGHGVAQVVGVGVRVGKGHVDVGADDGQGVAELGGGAGGER